MFLAAARKLFFLMTEYDKGLEWSRSYFESALHKSHAWQVAW